MGFSFLNFVGFLKDHDSTNGYINTPSLVVAIPILKVVCIMDFSVLYGIPSI